LLPAQLGERHGLARRLLRMLARRRAVEHALGDALADGGDAEQVVGQVELPDLCIDCCPTASPAVGLYVFRFRRNAQFTKGQAGYSPELIRRNMKTHAVIREVGERVAERG